MTDKEIFDRVLFIGPSLNGGGGMAALLKAYRRVLPVFHFSATNSPKGTLRGFIPLILTMLRLPVERLRGRRIAHIHYTVKRSWPRKWMLGKWASLLGYRVVMHCHSGAMANFCRKRGERRIGHILNGFDHSVVLSQGWKKYFTDTLGVDNVTAIPNIIEPIAPSPTPPVDDKHPFTFLFLGTITENKGIFELLEACGRLTGNWRLLVGGTGDMDRFNADLDRLNISDKVEYLGWVGGPHKDEAFARTHALILPSHYEGLPMSILEALSLKRGVIATPVGAITEVIENNESGQIVEIKNIDQIARAMQNYIDFPNTAQQHGTKGSKITSHFTPEAIITLLKEVYKTLN